MIPVGDTLYPRIASSCPKRKASPWLESPRIETEGWIALRRL